MSSSEPSSRPSRLETPLEPGAAASSSRTTNEDGIVLVPGADIKGKSVIGKIVVYPTVLGSTTGAISMYYKVKVSHHGPAAIICRKVHDIDISGTLAAEIPAVDSLDRDPITEIKTGDWVEIDAPKVGQKATVTITRKA
ncbi:aconitase X swivel domain-containing protein [Bradyrhizobium sp. 63_E2_N1_3]|uniref:aconitase X swivel domain-containing protein n=1 Tax=Bradyrhizobium sp. 63_E2_N1_3 TaxID=3240373 RepID=UPI003F8CA31A